MVPAVDRAPLVSFAWLFFSASMAASVAPLICSLLKCEKTPVVSDSLRPVMLLVTCSTRAGAPSMNWLTTNVRMPPTTTNPVSRTTSTAAPRGRPRRSRKSTIGISIAASMVASATGTTINSRCLTTHSSASNAARMTSSRHDQAAALRTSGCTAASAIVRHRSDTGTSTPNRARALWHAGSVTTRRARSGHAHSARCRRYPVGVSHDAPTSDATCRESRQRGKYWWVRWAIIGVAVVVLAVEVVLVWDQLAKAWRSLLSANWWWVLAAVVRRAGLDAQLRADPAHPAEVRRRRGQAVALRGGLLRGQCTVHHDAGRTRALGDVRVSAATALGRFPGGGVVAAGHVRRAAGGRPGAARPRRRIPARRQQEPAVADLHARRLRRAAAAGAVRRVQPAADRRHRGAGAVVVQLVARQARRHGPGQVARDAASNSSRSA